MTDRQCEARTSKGDRCQCPGLYYLSYTQNEYLVCKRHYSYEFRPVTRSVKKTASLGAV